MISRNSRATDKEDIAVLFFSLCRYAESNGPATDRTTVSIGFSELLERAERAADVIAKHHRSEGQEWDGVVWLELLLENGEDSLAADLFEIDSDDENTISKVTLNWLQYV